MGMRTNHLPCRLSWRLKAARSATVVAVGAVFALAPGIAAAHAGLVKSVPGSRSVLNHAPARIELCFNEEVELKFSSVKLLAPDQAMIQVGELAYGSDGPKCIVVGVPPLEKAGTYTVKYKILSQDGHVVEYGYPFNLQPAP